MNQDSYRGSSGNKQKTARKQEESLAARVGGRRQPGSGNKIHAPGDVSIQDLMLMEAKYTERPYYFLNKDVLGKIRQEARRTQHSFWAMEIMFKCRRSVFVYVVDANFLLLHIPKHTVSITINATNRRSIRIIPTHHASEVVLVQGWDADFYLITTTTFQEGINNAMSTQTSEETGPFYDIGEVLHMVYGDLNNKESERTVGVIGPSSLGGCKRAAWYRLLYTKERPTVTPNMRIIFEIGHLVHKQIQTLLKEVFGDWFRAEVPAEIPKYHLHGSCDGLFARPHIDAELPTLPAWLSPDTRDLCGRILSTLSAGERMVIEIKTTSRVITEPIRKHLLQGTAYGMALGAHSICFLYINKSSGTITRFVRATANPVVQSEILTYLETVKGHLDAGTEPPRESDSDCTACHYRYVCLDS